MTAKSTGIVEKIEFTHGGMGNQITTINGVRYITFWDIRTKDWREGDTVSFLDVTEPVFSNTAPVRQAKNIRKVNAADTGQSGPPANESPTPRAAWMHHFDSADEALDAIAAQLHRQTWTPETTSDIADIIRATGREVGEPD